MEKLTADFFRQDPAVVARKILGKKLVRIAGGKELEGIIAMASAYRGEVARKQKGLFYHPGQLYLPVFTGGYRKLAIATESDKEASVITIDRIVVAKEIGKEIKKEILSSGKICPYFQLGSEMDNMPCCSNELWIEPAPDCLVEELTNVPMAENCTGRYALES